MDGIHQDQFSKLIAEEVDERIRNGETLHAKVCEELVHKADSLLQQVWSTISHFHGHTFGRSELLLGRVSKEIILR
jgi:hypothetical protein